MSIYTWTLSLHDGAETFTGTVNAANQQHADEAALIEALGNADDRAPEPDSQEPGVMRWAYRTGVTTLTVVESNRLVRAGIHGDAVCPRCRKRFPHLLVDEQVPPHTDASTWRECLSLTSTDTEA